MHIKATFEQGVFDFYLLQEPEIIEGVKYFEFGGKKIQLPDGWFAKSIQVFPSGKIRLFEREAVKGKGSGYSYPANCELKIIKQ